MLVLTRKQGEQIVIGPDVIVTVLEAPGRVRLGIDAPDHVLIKRSELLTLAELDAVRKAIGLPAGQLPSAKNSRHDAR